MAFPWLMGAAAGGSFLSNLYQQFNPTARRYKKLQDQQEMARAKAALADAQAAEDQASEDHPYEQAVMRQGYAARRFGKSSDKMDIANQGMGRLSRAQARQMAALQRNKQDANRGISLIKQRRKYDRRMQPMQIFGGLASSFGSMAPFLGGKDD